MSKISKATKECLNVRSHRAIVDATTDWVIEKIEHFLEHDQRPLIVPMTVTFFPNSIEANRTLGQFELFYKKICRQLMPNPNRPSKWDLLPFTIAYLDDPSTRWKIRRPIFISNHPQVAPHIHALMIVHPDQVETFYEMEAGFDKLWKSVSPRTNSSLDIPFKKLIEYHELLEGYPITKPRIRSDLRGWLDYSSKLQRRPNSEDEFDVFDVFPNCLSKKTDWIKPSSYRLPRTRKDFVGSNRVVSSRDHFVQ